MATSATATQRTRSNPSSRAMQASAPQQSARASDVPRHEQEQVAPRHVVVLLEVDHARQDVK